MEADQLEKFDFKRSEEPTEKNRKYDDPAPGQTFPAFAPIVIRQDAPPDKNCSTPDQVYLYKIICAPAKRIDLQ